MNDLYCICLEKMDFLLSDMKSSAACDDLIEISRESFNLRILEPKLHVRFVEFLSSLAHPDVRIWDEALLKPSNVLSEGMVSHCVISVIKELVRIHISVATESS
jgi:hypothetical protein